MSSFNEIKKFKYVSNQNDLVSVLEYAICLDAAYDKFAVVKLKNNITQSLFAVGYIVTQYDSDGDIIKRSNIYCSNFETKGGEEFVPNAKMKLDASCCKLTFELVEAKFEKMLFDCGKVTSILFTDDVEEKEKAKKKEKKAKKRNEKKHYKNVFKISKRSKPVSKFATIFCSILSVLTIIATIVLAIITKLLPYSCIIADGVVYAPVKGNDTYAVYDFEGSKDTVVIPRTINSKRVVMICGNAFKNSKVKNVYAEAENLYIDTNAFYGSSIERFTATGEVTTASKAFNSCSKLITFNAPNAFLNMYTFIDCKSIENLIYNRSTNINSFDNIFGETLTDFPKSLTYVSSYDIDDTLQSLVEKDKKNSYYIWYNSRIDHQLNIIESPNENSEKNKFSISQNDVEYTIVNNKAFVVSIDTKDAVIPSYLTGLDGAKKEYCYKVIGISDVKSDVYNLTIQGDDVFVHNLDLPNLSRFCIEGNSFVTDYALIIPKCNEIIASKTIFSSYSVYDYSLNTMELYGSTTAEFSYIFGVNSSILADALQTLSYVKIYSSVDAKVYFANKYYDYILVK